jgi:hypothetical protein
MSDIVVGEYSFNPSKQIGKGRHSTVYEGYHAGSGTKVAIKKVDWASIHNRKHDMVKKKIQQALELQKRKAYEHVVKLLGFQVCTILVCTGIALLISFLALPRC